VTEFNLEKTMELLGSTDIQGSPAQLKELVQWTRELVKERGESWVKENRKLLLSQWEHILQLGL